MLSAFVRLGLICLSGVFYFAIALAEVGFGFDESEDVMEQGGCVADSMLYNLLEISLVPRVTASTVKESIQYQFNPVVFHRHDGRQWEVLEKWSLPSLGRRVGCDAILSSWLKPEVWMCVYYYYLKCARWAPLESPKRTQSCV